MDRNGVLRLDLVNVYGEPLGEKVDINLRHQVLSDTRIVRGAPASKRIVIKDLYGAPQGLYRIEINPPSYFPVSQFVNLKASGHTDLEICFPIDPRKVREVSFRGYQELPDELRKLLDVSDAVLSFEGKKGGELYKAMDGVRKAGLLNIVAKSRATPLTNAKTVLPYIERLREIRGDRFFAQVSKELPAEARHSVSDGLFCMVSGALHPAPAGYHEDASFKTEDRYGNLQLTFFTNGTDYLADIDIDDAAGLEHVFQVLRNALTGRRTHPYDIHEILVAYQHIDPGYRFVV